MFVGDDVDVDDATDAMDGVDDATDAMDGVDDAIDSMGGVDVDICFVLLLDN